MGRYRTLESECRSDLGRTGEKGELALCGMVGQKPDIGFEIADGGEEFFVISEGIDRVSGYIDPNLTGLDDVAEVGHIGWVYSVVGQTRRWFGEDGVGGHGAHFGALAGGYDTRVIANAGVADMFDALFRTDEADLRISGDDTLDRLDAGVVAVVVGQKHVGGTESGFVERGPSMDKAVAGSFAGIVGIDLNDGALRVF